ncbi:pyridoxamine 5'-phosphate oxidase [Ichthyobacterium seriolicida]|uniref:Pyridoxine/pyridoxamine 5'-phosphate oxidase n=1 Tax=Ichthyobacterium seriolicida TaxID=242600 RepID=A0A1J1DZ52_9FLAO|nr:pyridoxamine 5'-phosphate oxidase [Ichthyobacterium seriolicida]BAV95191.1 pyridoxamine 5'-phosphate oxidase [Ichthyobacterium seriolicida]
MDINLINTDSDPIVEFSKWFCHAKKEDPTNYDVMVLSTLQSNGYPRSRVVLLKSFCQKGFVFFTNYQSEKGRAIENNPRVSLTFFWQNFKRQININGIAEKINDTESDKYYSSRPLGSQISAWASPQSEQIESRDFLEKRWDEFKSKFEIDRIYRPKNWGGYIINPVQMEFWQDKEDRLHNRILYKKEKDIWGKSILAP